MVRSVVGRHRPAHTTYEVCELGQGMRVGRHLHLDLTSVVGPDPSCGPAVVGQVAVGGDGVVGVPAVAPGCGERTSRRDAGRLSWRPTHDRALRHHDGPGRRATGGATGGVRRASTIVARALADAERPAGGTWCLRRLDVPVRPRPRRRRPALGRAWAAALAARAPAALRHRPRGVHYVGPETPWPTWSPRIASGGPGGHGPGAAQASAARRCRSGRPGEAMSRRCGVSSAE